MKRGIQQVALCLLATVSLAAGCGEDDQGTMPGDTTGKPSEVTAVATEGFESPLDAVASPDGSIFYFTAYTTDEEPEAALFSVPSAGGAVELLHAGAPLSMPTGLVMSCDGSQLFVADMSQRDAEEDADEEAALDSGGLYVLPTAGGELTALQADGIAEPTGLALSFDCQTLYVTGWTEDGEPALFQLPIEGGTASVVHAGAPLISPTGMYVDKDEVAWVLDHLASSDGEGVLFAIDQGGEVSTVVEGLDLGTAGGCSLDSAASTAYVPTRGEDGISRLTTIEIATGAVAEIDTPEIEDPAGLRTARDAAVFAVVDHEGNAIYRAQ